ncbi:CBS domain-containing protein [Roseomonas xinghualingensis]|uniref:CBS domain-containing protein n=1 Tax=Roseomonas xinghualingensis TaxID=2986475 RepID=UPI0021F1BA58|nr:CBS domain-containing protein [Roseomonas sp. SXEYE001]MCV4208013.1 CBS domain-containing protein [Roseomonas sp. SXEYE001]
MTIADILRNKGSKILSVTPGMALTEVARFLVHHRIGAVLVREEAGEEAMLGILSERDIVRALAEDEGSVKGLVASDVMTRVLHTVMPQMPVTHALAMVTDRRVRHLPVLDGGKLCGIVSIGDLVKARIDEAVTEAAALRDYVAAG